MVRFNCCRCAYFLSVVSLFQNFRLRHTVFCEKITSYAVFPIHRLGDGCSFLSNDSLSTHNSNPNPTPQIIPDKKKISPKAQPAPQAADAVTKEKSMSEEEKKVDANKLRGTIVPQAGFDLLETDSTNIMGEGALVFI